MSKDLVVFSSYTVTISYVCVLVHLGFTQSAAFHYWFMVAVIIFIIVNIVLVLLPTGRHGCYTAVSMCSCVLSDQYVHSVCLLVVLCCVYIISCISGHVFTLIGSLQ